MAQQWNARAILTQLCDVETRHAITSEFWRHADQTHRLIAAAHLAKLLRFREETVKKAPVEKKAEWLASRAASHEIEDFVEEALLIYHARNESELMSAFLDAWGVPHVNGSIEGDHYTVPSREAIEASVAELSPRFSDERIARYLAAAGLLMGDQWRASAWPVVDTLAAKGTFANAVAE